LPALDQSADSWDDDIWVTALEQYLAEEEDDLSWDELIRSNI
jgi:hypothetical protein